jgi:hypothetical protein
MTGMSLSSSKASIASLTSISKRRYQSPFGYQSIDDHTWVDECRTFPERIRVIVTAESHSHAMRYFKELGCDMIDIPGDALVVENMLKRYVDRPSFLVIPPALALKFPCRLRRLVIGSTTFSSGRVKVASGMLCSSRLSLQR